MARKMNPEKPGVMIYFKEIRGLTKRMDDHQKARLLDAIVDYAERGVEPDFSDDPLLDTAFYGSIIFAVDRDDERFTEKSLNRKYSNYVRWSEKDHAYIVSREEFRAAGCPPFSEIKKRLIQMDTSGGKWNQMDFFYSVWNALTNTSPSSTLKSSPPLTSSSEPASATVEPPDGGWASNATPDSDECDEINEDKDPPYHKPTREEVRRYCRQRNLQYTDPDYYYDYYAANGWIVGAKSGNPRLMADWKAHIRNWNAGNRKKEEGAARRGQDVDDTLRALCEEFRREDGI